MIFLVVFSGHNFHIMNRKVENTTTNDNEGDGDSIDGYWKNLKKQKKYTHTQTNKLLIGCAGGSKERWGGAGKNSLSFIGFHVFLSFSVFSFVGRYYVSVLFLMVANCERVHGWQRERARQGKTVEVIKGVLSVPQYVCVWMSVCVCA